MKTAEQVLREAAEYIRKHGWLTEQYGEDGGPRCMAGAMYSATESNDFIPIIARRALDEVIGTVIAEFNDHHCRTADDAIAALLIAADLAAPEWKP